MAAAVPTDRRHGRRQESIEQVLAVAVEVMSEQGVAGLTLGEVARRMGIRMPSLCGYFAGRNSLYGELFRRGWAELLAAVQAGLGGDPLEEPYATTEIFVRWSVEHPAYAPLMSWRSVPGFTPSEAACVPAVELSRSGRDLLVRLQSAGVPADDADLDLAWRTWTTGVITQQLTNAPGEPYESGTFTSTEPDLLAMWLPTTEQRSADPSIAQRKGTQMRTTTALAGDPARVAQPDRDASMQLAATEHGSRR